MESTVWFVTDLETTGLEPEKDAIIEIASIAVNARTLEELGRFHRLVRPSPTKRMPDPWCLKTHADSGLWAEIQAGGDQVLASECELAQAFFSFADPYRAGTGKITLAGNSVHFDLGFLWAVDGFCRGWIGHRVINVSTFRDVFAAWGLPKDPPGFVSSSHRAMADAEHSLAVLRHVREVMRPVFWARTVHPEIPSEVESPITIIPGDVP